MRAAGLIAGLTLGLLVIASSLSSGQTDELGLDRYSCAEFPTDTQPAATSDRTVKAWMMISWVTGYAAAHDKAILRADSAAIALIAATIDEACRKSPQQTVIEAATNTINQFAAAEPTTAAGAAATVPLSPATIARPREPVKDRPASPKRRAARR